MTTYVRTGSGVWKLVEEDPRAVGAPAPVPVRTPPPPVPSAPSGTQPVPLASSSSGLRPAPLASSPSGVRRRGLPSEPREKARALAEQARADYLAGQYAAAESGLRLALTYLPGDHQLAMELKVVSSHRERLRKSGSVLGDAMGKLP